MIELLFDLPRPLKRLISVLFDTVVIVGALVFVTLIDGGSDAVLQTKFVEKSAVVVVTSILFFIKIGLYRAIIRYMGLKALFTVSFGIFFSTLALGVADYIFNDRISITSLFLYWSFALISIGGARALALTYLRGNNKSGLKQVAIYGAGMAGRQLAKSLEHSSKYNPVFFIDDDPLLYRSKIDGMTVYSPVDLGHLIEQHKIERILLAIPSATRSRRFEILRFLEPLPVKIKTIAGLEEIVDGKVKLEELRDVEIEDLLGRDPVPPVHELLHGSVTGKNVMVTGSGGSIGSELCRQIIALQPNSLVLYELSEFALYAIEKELSEINSKLDKPVKVIPLLGSVQHRNRLKKALNAYNIQTIYHAAAYKHVPIVENNIVEGIRNNVFGTWYAAEAAIECGVERFVLISTDKAVRPTNVMGASKRLAELVLQAVNQRGSSTTFTMVRFGNVLGSSGSVVPLFRKQIKSGGPVTVTHPDITRYFMTIPEAAQLVLQAGTMGKGGDVFVLDMGEPVRIIDLAEKMIHLMGLSVKNEQNPQGDIEIVFSGLRPGEKLYEELLVGNNVVGTLHPKIMAADEKSISWDDMQRALLLLDELCADMNCDGIVQMLLKLPTDFSPTGAVCDLLWDEDKDKNNVIRFKTLS